MMKKVLVVDDAQVELMNLRNIVQSAGCQCLTANSGEEALSIARAEQPDLVFMDVNMPGLDGFSVVRQLSADPTTKGIPVVFVTGKDQRADRVFAQMLGAKGYITKPYAADQITSALSAAR